VKIAAALGVPADRFYSNIRRYGNTSSASMLIAAAEWLRETPPIAGAPVVFAAFGAGFHWARSSPVHAKLAVAAVNFPILPERGFARTRY